MPLLYVVLALIGVGVLLWAMERYVPLDPTIKRIIHVVVILVVIVWLLKLFGVWAALMSVHV